MVVESELGSSGPAGRPVALGDRFTLTGCVFSTVAQGMRRAVIIVDPGTGALSVASHRTQARRAWNRWRLPKACWLRQATQLWPTQSVSQAGCCASMGRGLLARASIYPLSMRRRICPG